jgi:hypothetical protein
MPNGRAQAVVRMAGKPARGVVRRLFPRQAAGPPVPRVARLPSGPTGQSLSMSAQRAPDTTRSTNRWPAGSRGSSRMRVRRRRGVRRADQRGRAYFERRICSCCPRLARRIRSRFERYLRSAVDCDPAAWRHRRHHRGRYHGLLSADDELRSPTHCAALADRGAARRWACQRPCSSAATSARLRKNGWRYHSVDQELMTSTRSAPTTIRFPSRCASSTSSAEVDAPPSRPSSADRHIGGAEVAEFERWFAGYCGGGTRSASLQDDRPGTGPAPRAECGR